MPSLPPAQSNNLPMNKEVIIHSEIINTPTTASFDNQMKGRCAATDFCCQSQILPFNVPFFKKTWISL
jgi:hypothetical protein